MFPLIKFLKIVLPVATATAATIVTSSLVSFRKTDLDKTKDNEDQELSDFVNPDEKHEEKKLFYSKEGDAKELTSISAEQAEQIEKILKEKNGDLGKGKQLGGGDVSEKVNLPQNSEKVDGDTGQNLDTPQESVPPISDQNSTESDEKNNLNNDDAGISKDVDDLSDESVLEVQLPISEPIPPKLKPSDTELTKDSQEDRGSQDDSSNLPSDEEDNEAKGDKLEQTPKDKVNEGIDSVNDSQEVNSSEADSEVSGNLTNKIEASHGKDDSKNEPSDSSSYHNPEGEKGAQDLGGNVKQYSDEEIRKLEELKSELSKFSSELEGLIDLDN